jgi:hypothetical protein
LWGVCGRGSAEEELDVFDVMCMFYMKYIKDISKNYRALLTVENTYFDGICLELAIGAKENMLIILGDIH